mmetsp:Transcript_23643/g.60375  ORF Transcript_23643/g.60375 Transcript_23643/m.60375 type:complete len:107 (-) Transcript_23643:248-568(-)
MTIVVHADARITSSRALCTTFSLSTSSALVASSSKRTFGRFATARAMAMRCFWPPLNCTPLSPTSVARPSGSFETKSHALASLHTFMRPSSSSMTSASSSGAKPKP